MSYQTKINRYQNPADKSYQPLYKQKYFQLFLKLASELKKKQITLYLLDLCQVPVTFYFTFTVCQLCPQPKTACFAII